MLQIHKLIGFWRLFPDFKFAVIQGFQEFLGYSLYGTRRDKVSEIFQEKQDDRVPISEAQTTSKAMVVLCAVQMSLFPCILCGRDGGKKKTVADGGRFFSLLPLGTKEEWKA